MNFSEISVTSEPSLDHSTDLGVLIYNFIKSQFLNDMENGSF